MINASKTYQSSSLVSNQNKTLKTNIQNKTLKTNIHESFKEEEELTLLNNFYDTKDMWVIRNVYNFKAIIYYSNIKMPYYLPTTRSVGNTDVLFH